jgi:hypothetical protein
MNSTPDGVHTTTGANETGWVNTANGVVLSRHHKKESAITTGRRIAKRHNTVHTIHREDGAVISTKSYERAAL